MWGNSVAILFVPFCDAAVSIHTRWTGQRLLRAVLMRASYRATCSQAWDEPSRWWSGARSALILFPG